MVQSNHLSIGNMSKSIVLGNFFGNFYSFCAGSICIFDQLLSPRATSGKQMNDEQSEV